MVFDIPLLSSLLSLTIFPESATTVTLIFSSFPGVYENSALVFVPAESSGIEISPSEVPLKLYFAVLLLAVSSPIFFIFRIKFKVFPASGCVDDSGYRSSTIRSGSVSCTTFTEISFSLFSTFSKEAFIDTVPSSSGVIHVWEINVSDPASIAGTSSLSSVSPILYIIFVGSEASVPVFLTSELIATLLSGFG